MKIIKTTPIIKDGGSINEIITDKGIFSLVKKIGGKNNGFYGENGKVDDSVGFKLEKALSFYFSAKKAKENKQNLPDAIKVLCEALRTDESYRIGWVANIAMQFKDECYREFEKDLSLPMTFPEIIHKLSNTAAENFINLLVKDDENNSR